MFLISNGILLIYNNSGYYEAYQDELFDYVDSVDLVSRVFCELAIAHKGEETSISLIVDAEYDWIVVYLSLRLEELIRSQMLHVELARFIRNCEAHASLDPHFLDVVIFIRCVHHNRDVVPIFLLGHACVNSQIAIT